MIKENSSKVFLQTKLFVGKYENENNSRYRTTIIQTSIRLVNQVSWTQFQLTKKKNTAAISIFNSSSKESDIQVGPNKYKQL